MVMNLEEQLRRSAKYVFTDVLRAAVIFFVGVSGLAELASRKYKPAAKCFLQASFDHCDCPEVSKVTTN